MLLTIRPPLLNKIRIDIDKLTTFFDLEDILLISSKNSLQKCFFKNGKEIIINTTFEILSQSIDKNRFLIIGNEYIVNRDEVKRIKKTETGCTIYLNTNKKFQIYTTFDSITQNMTFV